MNAVAACLSFNTQSLVDAMLHQLPELIVVDNGSSPPYYLSKIRSETNLFFAGGWNYAMRQLMDMEYVWMLNDDITGATPHMLENLVSLARKGYAVVTPAFNSPHALFHRQADSIWREVRWIDWCCPLVSTKAWKDAGEFDERFVGYGADIDWCKRARDKGYKFAVADWLEINHLGSVSSLRNGTQAYMGDVGRMNRLLHEKYRVNNWTQLT